MKTFQRTELSQKAGRLRSSAFLYAACWLLLTTGARAQSSFYLPLGWNYNANGTLGLQWSGAGSLESAPSLAGPWTAVANSISYSGSATQAVSGTAGFFRVHNGSRIGYPLPAPIISPLPPITSATIQRLAAPTAAGDTLLQVVFQPPSGPAGGLSTSNFFTIDDQVYLLRDDGVYPDTVANDGVYSAIIPLSTSELQAWNDHVAEVMATGPGIEPVFTGRTITSSNVLTSFDIISFLNHITIPLLPFPCSLGASDFYDWRKTIMINDLSVVGDLSRTYDPCIGVPSMGPWSFGYLMSNMCNQVVTGIDPADFTRHWLLNWEFDQTVNFDLVPNRSNNIVSQVIASWVAASGGGTNLNLAIAPFRLLAIVNRLDLRSHAFPYDNAGECRFVFGVVNPSSPCSFLPFTVIFEYGVPMKGCSGIKGWANQWAALNSIPFGPGYNAALEAITDQVTAAGADPSKSPNLSAINQIRSNDQLVPPDWDLREFTLDGLGYLDEHTVKNNPAGPFNGSSLINAYCTDPLHLPNILIDNDTVPLFYLSMPFLGGHALNPPGVWDGNPPATIAAPVRIHFSLNTCNGCHGGETATLFTHVSPRPFGAPATLSGFPHGS
ncbi:MAG: choice-of-anchor X domain-containing protein [Verrucomicrobiia bacterium]